MDTHNYLIVRPERGGIRDLWRYAAYGDEGKFLELSLTLNQEDGFYDNGDVEKVQDSRWMILVSIMASKIVAALAKPMKFTGYALEFALNFLSSNGQLCGLVHNILHGRVVIPERGSETFVSIIGHIDGRIDLLKMDQYSDDEAGQGKTATASIASAFQGEIEENLEMGHRALMDLCAMASKLAYENEKVVRNIVVQHWKMHFVDFYNCWNDFVKQMSTKAFIMCDKPKDADLILISFRGTEPFDADDWRTDFDYSWYKVPNVGKLHMGFLEALGLGNRANVATFHQHLITQTRNFEDSNSIPSDQLTAYYIIKNKMKSLIQEHRNAKFVVTGHSLGGALAVLLPTVLVLHEEEELMQRLQGVYAFGQPRVGNSELAEFMQSHLESPVQKYFRVVYCNDLVPRLPFDDKTFSYKHFGICLYYDSFYMEREMEEEPNKNYFGWRYMIPEHINAVWELIRSFAMGFVFGAEYREGLLSTLFRFMGLALPGISAHCPTDYVNSVRLGWN